MTTKLTVASAIFISAFAFGQATKPAAVQPARVSADGVQLPDATLSIPMIPDVPLIKQRLGTLPEKCVPKLYNAQKSRQLLQRRTKIDAAFDWFGWDVANANVCGLKVTDGRVTAIALVFNAMDDSTFKRIRQEIVEFHKLQQNREPNTPQVFVKLVRRAKTGAEFVAAIQPAEWYALTKALRPEIREGMRDAKPVIGMTKEELLLTMGNPSSQSESQNGNARYVWDGSVPGDYRGRQVDLRLIAVGVPDDDTDPLASIGSYERSGSFIVDVRDGAVVQVSEPRK